MHNYYGVLIKVAKSLQHIPGNQSKTVTEYKVRTSLAIANLALTRTYPNLLKLLLTKNPCGVNQVFQFELLAFNWGKPMDFFGKSDSGSKNNNNNNSFGRMLAGSEIYSIYL